METKSGVYILYSESGDRYYIGSTNNHSYRLHQHNSGWVNSTKNYLPWDLKVFIECVDLAEARRYEYKLKKYKRRDILNKVIKDGEFPWNSKGL